MLKIRKFLAILLTAVMLLSCLPANLFAVEETIIAEGNCGDDITWKLSSNGVLTLEGSGDMPFYGTANAPWSENLDNVTSVVIADGITSVSSHAFYNCLSIESVTIPSSVRSIESYAFFFCQNLKDVTIMNGVTTIENSAFSVCTSLEEITIPNSVTSIGDSAFSVCASLEEIAIPSSVTSIGDGVFSGCESLTEITVDATNPNYTSVDGVLFNKNNTELICYPANRVGTTYTVPETVQIIGASAFESVTNLDAITLSNNVTKISENAFNSASIKTISIPSSVVEIEDRAFFGCDSLTEINVDPANSHYSSMGGVLFDKDATILIQFPCGKSGVYTMPSGVKEIADDAFFYADKISLVNFPETLEAIGMSAFVGSSIETVYLPDSVTAIGRSAFLSCKNLVSIRFPQGLETIENALIQQSTALKEVIIPDSVKYIGNSAFYQCTSLETINLPKNLETIDRGAFASCSALKSVTIPSNVKTVDRSAFTECSSLEEMTFMSATVPNGDNPFGVMESLEKVFVPAQSLDAYIQAYSSFLPEGAEICAISDGITSNGFVYSVEDIENSERVLTLSWDAIPEATYYRVSYKIGNSDTYVRGTPTTELSCSLTLDATASYEIILEYSPRGTAWHDTEITLLATAISEPNGIPGDVNGDGEFTYTDISKLYARFRGLAEVDERVNLDINGDGSFTYTDVSKLYAIYRGLADFPE